MRIVFLGTNGWYTSPMGNTACILIDSKDYYVVLDAGNGIYKLDKYINPAPFFHGVFNSAEKGTSLTHKACCGVLKRCWIKENKPIFMFISHFHLDHVSGLHSLNKFNFKQGIDVYVGKGRRKDFETLVNPPYTIGFRKQAKNIKNLPYDIRIQELSEKNNILPFPISSIELFHAYKDHGYRFELDGKIIAYSGDTGIGRKSMDLAKNADCLIHECSYVEPRNDNWGHVDPAAAAKLAKEANVKKLVLTHFDASQYTTFEKRKIAERKAQKIFPNTISTWDNMVIKL